MTDRQDTHTERLLEHMSPAFWALCGQVPLPEAPLKDHAPIMQSNSSDRTMTSSSARQPVDP